MAGVAGGRKQPPLTERLNMPVQGTGADILKQALGLLPAALKETGARIIATVHDEIVLEAPEAHAQEVAARLETIMTQAGHTSVTRVPIEVEVVIAINWMKKSVMLPEAGDDCGPDAVPDAPYREECRHRAGGAREHAGKTIAGRRCGTMRLPSSANTMCTKGPSGNRWASDGQTYARWEDGRHTRSVLGVQRRIATHGGDRVTGRCARASPDTPSPRKLSERGTGGLWGVRPMMMRIFREFHNRCPDGSRID